MAWRVAMRGTTGGRAEGSFGSICRWAHAVARSPPLETAIISTSSPPLVLPENKNDDFNREARLPSSPLIHWSMELMAVPKKKVSRHKRGIRNGPKALKPVPVIVRCRACGRVKLPHFFCCSGIKPNPSDQYD